MWTRKAIAQEFVRQEGDAFYFHKMANGSYVATGQIGNRTIRRDYTVNKMKDHQSPWAMWNDFNGRYGLTKIWYLYWGEDNRQHRMLIWNGDK